MKNPKRTEVKSTKAKKIFGKETPKKSKNVFGKESLHDDDFFQIHNVNHPSRHISLKELKEYIQNV